MTAVALLVAGAALGWSGVFGDGGALAVLAVVGLTATALTAGSARIRGPVAAKIGVLGAGFVIAAAVAGERRPPTPATIAAVAGGLRDGWAQILDTRLPVEPRGAPMTTAVAVLWVAGCLAAAAQAHGHRGLRLAAPLVAATTGLALAGAAGEDPPGWAALVLIGAAGAVLISDQAGADQAGATARTLARPVVAGAAVLGVVAVVGTAWPGASARERFDPRRLRAQPVAVDPVVNPLSALGGALAGADREEFRASIAGGPLLPRWRLVVLDRFDGTGWTATPTFRRVGARLRPPDPAGPATDVEQTVTITGGGWGPFLPALDAPIDIDADGQAVAADDHGALASPAGADRIVRYRVRSLVPDIDPAAVELAPPAPGEALTPIPADVRARLDAVVQESRARSGAGASGAAQLHALATGFADTVRVVPAEGAPEAPPTGNGYFHIGELLRERAGTAEQTASAFAVVARMQGYQARVVVGYRAGTRDPASGQWVVHRHDMHAWPEVRFEGVGWIPFEPTRPAPGPGDGSSPPPPDDPPDVAAAPPPGAAEPGEDPGAGGDHDQRPGSAATTLARSAVVTATLVLAGAVLLLGGAAVALAAAKAARRRRQQSGSPAERVAGAWSAALDRLSEAGVTVPRHLVATEVPATPDVPAAAIDPLHDLAVAANTGRFSGAPVTVADADAAWSAVDDVAGAVRASHPSLRLALSPAPFLRR